MINKSPMNDPIPDLTAEQHAALQSYLEAHYTEETYSLNPLTLTRLLADDKRGGYINCIRKHRDGDPDEYLPPLFDQLGLYTRQIDGVDGYDVARTAWRLELLPSKKTLTDSYHRRCGLFYDYPQWAVEDFIITTVNVTQRDMVRSGVFEAEEISYLIFVPYTYHNNIEKYNELIENGKAIHHRYKQLSNVWCMPILETYATAVYDDTVAVYSGNGGSFSPPMMLPPDEKITKSDVEPLLS